MTKIYVPHIVMRKDPITQVLQPLHDLSPARAYGELVNVVQIDRGTPASLIKTAWDNMQGFNPDEDCLLMMGAPHLIAIVAGIAYNLGNGKFTMLVWNRIRSAYQTVPFNIATVDPLMRKGAYKGA